MKFIVDKNYEDIFVDEVSRDSIVHVDTRVFHSPKEFDEFFAGRDSKWLSVGSNHRVDENGYITRDMGMIDVWSMEINSLDELIEFCDKYGDVVVGDCMWNKAYKSILICGD